MNAPDRYDQQLSDLVGTLLGDGDRSGQVNAVVAWHPDRLHRSPLKLEEFISLVEATGCRVETVQAVSFDLSTPTGRAVARTVGAWARFESEHKAERLRRKHLELALNGKYAGSRTCPPSQPLKERHPY